MLSHHIGRQLGDALLQSMYGLLSPCRLIAERVFLHIQPLQHRIGDGLFLTQRRQSRLANFPRLHRFLNRGFGLRRGQRAGTQSLFGCCAGLFCLLPPAIEQEPFGQSQTGPQLPISCGLFRLPRQLGELIGQLFDHVINSRKIRFSAAQFQLGFMPPGIETRYPGRLFQNTTAGLGFGINQLTDLALPNEGRRMGAGAGIGKEHLHIPRPHIFTIGLISRANITGDAAYHIQKIIFIKARRRQAFGVIDLQADFCKITGRTCGRSREDHIFHTATPHGRRAVLAHNPAQCLE